MEEEEGEVCFGDFVWVRATGFPAKKHTDTHTYGGRARSHALTNTHSKSCLVMWRTEQRSDISLYLFLSLLKIK